MRPTNPAVYECPRGKNGLHTWRRREDGTAVCRDCATVLNKADANDCFLDTERRL